MIPQFFNCIQYTMSIQYNMGVHIGSSLEPLRPDSSGKGMGVCVRFEVHVPMGTKFTYKKKKGSSLDTPILLQKWLFDF